MCKSARAVHVVETSKNYDIPLSLGSDPWYADLIRNHKVRFKIDTGADVSVIPAQTHYYGEKHTFNLTDD